jgi:CRP-like cAMP-binding protein
LARELSWDEPPEAFTTTALKRYPIEAEPQQRQRQQQQQQQQPHAIVLTDRERRQLFERQISRMNQLQNNLPHGSTVNNTVTDVATKCTTNDSIQQRNGRDTSSRSMSTSTGNSVGGDNDNDMSFHHDRKTIYVCDVDTNDFHLQAPQQNESQSQSAAEEESSEYRYKYAYPVYEKTKEQIRFLQQSVHDHFIFMDINTMELHHFIMALQSQTFYNRGTKIIRQGDMGDYFYIVESGTVDFVQESSTATTTTAAAATPGANPTTHVVVGSCTTGGSFGELSLLYSSPRAVSCVVTSDVVVVWKIDRSTFRRILAHQEYQSRTNHVELLRSISIFQNLEDTVLTRFTKALTPVYWKAGQRIVQKGEEGSVFYIIQSGSVKVHDIGLGDSQVDDVTLGPGQYFGERALLTGEPRAANVTAISDVVVTMAMDRTTFEMAIGPLQNLLEREMRKQTIKSIPIFAHGDITDQEVELLADRMQEVCYRMGEHLAQAGTPYQRHLWMIRHGQLVVYSQKSDKLYNLKAGDYFGDKSLMVDDPNHISSHTATCEVNLTTWILTREQIESVLGDIHRLGHSVNFIKTKEDQSIQLKELKRVHILGQGAFGTVWLVTHNFADTSSGSLAATRTTNVYALKTINKAKVIDAKLDKAVIREKDLLRLLNHPFILNLVASYQDADNLYLLLPLVLGGELYSLLKRMKKSGRGIENNTVAFYAACVVEALKHFYIGQIAYRDLKLENLLIDSKGYGKIIDLGFAKVVTGKTYTLCGTPEMLAPEIIMSKGHDHVVDYWALGVIVYELLVGHTPFYERGSSQIDMFKRIVLVKYTTPDFVSDSAKTMIAQLLVRQPSLRLGNLANGYTDIKEQSWFRESGIDFKQILLQHFLIVVTNSRDY